MTRVFVAITFIMFGSFLPYTTQIYALCGDGSVFAGKLRAPGEQLTSSSLPEQSEEFVRAAALKVLGVQHAAQLRDPQRVVDPVALGLTLNWQSKNPDIEAYEIPGVHKWELRRYPKAGSVNQGLGYFLDAKASLDVHKKLTKYGVLVIAMIDLEPEERDAGREWAIARRKPQDGFSFRKYVFSPAMLEMSSYPNARISKIWADAVVFAGSAQGLEYLYDFRPDQLIYFPNEGWRLSTWNNYLMPHRPGSSHTVFDRFPPNDEAPWTDFFGATFETEGSEEVDLLMGSLRRETYEALKSDMVNAARNRPH